MKEQILLKPIGLVRKTETGFAVDIQPAFIPALTRVEDFSHLQVLWWADRAASPAARRTLKAGQLFKKGPQQMGIFATRAPARPNPVMSSTIQITGVNLEAGVIRTPFIDAADGSPVLDIKPYFAMERVRDCQNPDWCAHWPQWHEEARLFNWEEEMNLPAGTESR